MKNKVIGLIVVGAMLLAGCSKGTGMTAAGQSAALNLKDGTAFSGTVVKSDTDAITVQDANGIVRTYPMTQVTSVKYVELPATGASTQAGSKAVPVPIHYASVPAGTRIRVRNSDAIRSDRATNGQTFPGVVTEDVIGDDGKVAIPKGADATLAIRSVRDQGKIKGQSHLTVDLDSVTVQGRQYTLETSDITRMGKQGLGKNRRSAKFIGGGAVLGTVIGAVAGGGAGAAIGAAAGGGAGFAAQTLTRGKAVRIPAESILSFSLEAATEIQPLE